jgi:hypothetical protein
MEEAFRALLMADPEVSGQASQINFGAHPQGRPLPAIVLNTISDIRAVTLTGPHSLRNARVQADCYATTYAAAKLLSRAVVDLCHGYRGGDFQGVFLASASDSREDRNSETAAEQPFRVSLDFTIHYNQR